MNIISEIPLWWLPIIAILALGASLWYYAKKDWKKEIQTATQLIEITQADISNEVNLLELEWNKTEAFRENYFHRMDYHSFVEMVRT